jgi:PAS domain S-box-containing protein
MGQRETGLAGDEARARLYDVMRDDGSTEERLLAALEVGRRYVGVDHGFVTEIDRETGDWEVVVTTDPSDGDVPEGMSLDLTTTYCRRTIREEGVLALHDVTEAGWEDDPAFETSGLQCYHGAPVVVDGEPYGTVCFAARDARAEPFSDAEKAFTDLIARMVSHEIERQRHERALDEREAEIERRAEIQRAIIDASFDLIFRIDRDGQYSYQSPTTESLLGYSAAELEGESFAKLFPDEETTEVGRRLFEQVLAGETVEELYLPLQATDGSTIYVDVRATPIYDADVPPAERTPEDIVAVQGMARDATDRKRRERLIHVLYRVLRHNLRNETTVITMLADALAERLDDENKEMAARIKRTATGLAALGDDARKLERNFDNPPEIRPMDVVDPVTAAITNVTERHPEASVTVETPDSAVANAAPRLQTAVRELLDNAAIHAGEAPSVDVTVATTDDEVLIRVADDGPGLPEQERTVLTTGKETSLAHGSGLGLWLVYWIVTSLDGTLAVDVEDGTRVEIRLGSPHQS